ncbi:MAG: hypothetical protein JXB38_18895 [Anaerolineales bacterium]|nr:hypothetical protein [Anaerolineales bacterium]
MATDTRPALPPVSRGERRWVWIFALVAMLVISLPYLVGFARQGEDWVFTGFVVGVEDGNSYIAKMMTGYKGDWLFHTPYTDAPQGGAIVLYPYVLLGKLTAPPAQHEQMVAIFHIFRYIGGVLAFLATYEFLSLFLVEVRLRRWGMILAGLGGGLGWLLVLIGRAGWLGSLPLDFYSPESFGFLALFGLPHIALGRALLLWGMVAFLRQRPVPINALADLQGVWFDQRGMLAGLCWLGLGLMQPLSVVVAWMVVAAYLLVLFGRQYWRRLVGRTRDWGTSWGYFRRAFWAVVFSAPMAIYTILHFSLDPFLKEWTAQNILPSPHPLHYLVAYGLVLPFAVVGARRLLKRHTTRGWLPIVWVLITPVLVYIPYPVQRRLAEGVWVALVLLALKSLEHVVSADRIMGKSSFKRLAVFLLLFPSTLFLWLGGLQVAWNPARPVFRPAQEIAAIQTFRELAEQDAVVLTAYETGNVLPAWVPVRVVYGHSVESLGYFELKPKVEMFYSTAVTDESRQAFLAEHHVDYIFWGPLERAVGAWDAYDAQYLMPVVEQGGYVVFAVVE